MGYYTVLFQIKSWGEWDTTLKIKRGFVSRMCRGAHGHICECDTETEGCRGFSEDKYHVPELLRVEG